MQQSRAPSTTDDATLQRLLNLTSAGPFQTRKLLGHPENRPTFLYPSKTISLTYLRPGDTPWLLGHLPVSLFFCRCKTTIICNTSHCNCYPRRKPFRPQLPALQAQRKTRRKAGWQAVSPPHCLRLMSNHRPSDRLPHLPTSSGTGPGDGCNPRHRWLSKPAPTTSLSSPS
ncbi:hypothetical protein LZ32DRAFT_83988 [Colletotrichum eremochloae]|nr:hypothetical protein LZ32DRAFT_83988 [Colletotrichum eremochloae]